MYISPGAMLWKEQKSRAIFLFNSVDFFLVAVFLNLQRRDAIIIWIYDKCMWRLGILGTYYFPLKFVTLYFLIFLLQGKKN